jgi:hypothetical protein
MLNRFGDEERIPNAGRHRWRNWSFMPHDVVLISNDASLASIVQTVIPTQGTLRILRASAELPPKHEFRAETVVLDLPAEIRLAARAEVRKRYSGRLLVALSSEDEAEGWPEDPACRFLVRPFRVDEVGEALRVPVPVADEAAEPSKPRPAEVATRAVATAGPMALGSRPGTPRAGFTNGDVVPETAAPGGDGDANGTQARTGTHRRPLASAPSATIPAPGPEQHHGLRSRRGLPASLLVVVMAVAAFGGVAIGRASVRPEDRSASSKAANQVAPPAAPSVTAPRSSQANACADAMDQADAAIAYLVEGVRDQRLTQAMQRYRDDRNLCQGNGGG